MIKDAKTKGDYFLGMGQQIGVIFNPTPIVSFSLGYTRLVTTYRNMDHYQPPMTLTEGSTPSDPKYFGRNTEISAGGVSGEITFYF
jgi:hypothetical protein